MNNCKKDKFLTVYAVLDDNSQAKLADLQKIIISLGCAGTQTMGIPFHVTLGSFHPDRESELRDRIKEVCTRQAQFTLSFDAISHFGKRVLFCSPTVTDELVFLRSLFDEDYAAGFEWHPHCTLFCGTEEEVEAAKELTERLFVPFAARVTAIELGEFFPTRIIIRTLLK